MIDRRVWLPAGAVGTAALAAALLAPPPGLEPAQTGATRLFATVTTAALVGVAILPVLFSPIVRRSGRRRLVWMALALVSLALGAIAFVGAGATQRRCTAHYDGRPVIVGRELTAVGEAYVTANPGLSRDELLFDAAGAASRLWTEASIDRCRSLVGGTYALWVPFLAICLFSSAQSVASGQLPVGVARPVGSAHSPGDTWQYDVFISYRHGGDDTAFARELLSSLERAGYAVAIDERDFPANASFLHEMERCIRQSRFTVALISSRYLGSGNCEEEATICKVLDMGDRRRRLIPLLIENVTLPAWLFGIVGIDCTKPEPLVDPFDKLLATLGPPLARPAPGD